MHKKRVFSILIILTLALTACNFPLLKDQEETVNEADLLSTAVAGTVQAMSLPEQPTAVFTVTPDQASQPTMTVPPTTAPIQQPTTSTQACNQALFLTETIPDDTQFYMGENFTKSWTLKNTGTCTWNTNYKLVFVSGDSMSGPASVNLTQNVAPDQEVVVSVALKAPPSAGTYTGYWALKADDESVFFSGISVKIEATAEAFMVSSVTTDLKDREPTCPYDYYYTVKITSTSSGKVKYYTTNSEGDTSSTKTLTFSQAGTIEEDLYMEITEDGAYWVEVYIESPNHQWFGPFNFDITCQ